MKGTRRLRFAALLALLTRVALPPGAAPAATPCTDCCQLPCVEAEIRLATKMQQWYREQAAVKGLTREAYEAGEKAKGAELAAERAKDTGSLAPCRFNMPDPKTDVVAVRQWSAAGWSIKEIETDGKKGYGYNFSLRTNTETCKLSEKQVELLHEITPCSGLADAAEKHERFHVTTCEKRKGRKETMNEAAADEVAAYDVELKELNALRDALRKACALKSCKDRDAKAAGERLEKELDELKKQVGRRGGK